jgi:iron complex outermembrane receptor protein
MGRRRTILGSSVGGFALVNATLLSRNLGKHADLSASLYNVFDKTYADPGGQELLNAVQQDGRNFRVKLTFHF